MANKTKEVNKTKEANKRGTSPPPGQKSDARVENVNTPKSTEDKSGKKSGKNPEGNLGQKPHAGNTHQPGSANENLGHAPAAHHEEYRQPALSPHEQAAPPPLYQSPAPLEQPQGYQPAHQVQSIQLQSLLQQLGGQQLGGQQLGGQQISTEVQEAIKQLLLQHLSPGQLTSHQQQLLQGLTPQQQQMLQELMQQQTPPASSNTGTFGALAHAVLHPIETAKNIIDGAKTAINNANRAPLP